MITGVSTAGARASAEKGRESLLVFSDVHLASDLNDGGASVPRSVAMAMVGQKTEEVYRRYAIVDEAMIREAAVKMNRGAKIRRSKPRRTADS